MSDIEQQKQILVHRINDVFEALQSEYLQSGLYLVATPIGHLGDITLRALAVLSQADVVAVEDTRQSGRLLSHYGIKTEMITYHDHNGVAMRPKIIEMIEAGRSVALISDAGTPLISDPGFKLAKDVRDAGHMVDVIPGPSALVAGLSLAGLPTDRFFFQGFLSPKHQARLTAFQKLKSVEASLIFFETVKRITAFLDDAYSIFGDRPVVLCRELTKLHQEVIEGSLSEVISLLKTRDLKGELVVLIGGPTRSKMSDVDIETALKAMLEEGCSMRDSVAEVTRLHDLPKKRVYTLSLALKKRLEDG